jgi:SPW repeat
MGRKEILFGATNLLGSGLIAASPWLFGYGGPPAWNDWTVAYTLAVIAAAVLTADAEWHGACLAIGAWLAVSPWPMGLPQASASILHVATGAAICVLALAGRRQSERTPPFWYRPGGALRALVVSAAEPHGDDWTAGSLRTLGISSSRTMALPRSVAGRRQEPRPRRRPGRAVRWGRRPGLASSVARLPTKTPFFRARRDLKFSHS